VGSYYVTGIDRATSGWKYNQRLLDIAVTNLCRRPV